MIPVIVTRLFCLEACVKQYFVPSSVSPQAESEEDLVKKTEVRRYTVYMWDYLACKVMGSK